MNQHPVPAADPTHTPAQLKRLGDSVASRGGPGPGVQRMLDDNRPCEEIVTQLLAARSALDQVIRQVLSERVADCLTLPGAVQVHDNVDLAGSSTDKCAPGVRC